MIGAKAILVTISAWQTLAKTSANSMADKLLDRALLATANAASHHLDSATLGKPGTLAMQAPSRVASTLGLPGQQLVNIGRRAARIAPATLQGRTGLRLGPLAAEIGEKAPSTRRAMMTGLLGGAASLALLGGASPTAAQTKERVHGGQEKFQRELSEARVELLQLDREAKQVKNEDPELARFIGEGQTIAVVGAVVGGVAANRRGVALEKEKKKVEHRLKIEESLMKKLMAVNKALKHEQRAARASKVAAAEAHTEAAGIAVDHDDTWFDVRKTLKRGREALSRKEVKEAETLFRQALTAAEGAREPDTDQARKAVHGLAAASQLAGNAHAAVGYMERCLELSTSRYDKADSLGEIADLYEASGDYEKASRYYDLWLKTIDTDEPTRVYSST